MISAIFRAIRSVFRRIFRFVGDLLRRFFPILLALATVWFAPAIAGWLTASGAPSWLASAFSAIGSLKPAVTSAVAWMRGAVVSSASWVRKSFSALTMGQRASLIVGTSALLAPEETATALTEVADFVGETVGGVVGSVAAAVFSSPTILIGAGLAAVWFLSRRGEVRETQPYYPSAPRQTYSATPNEATQ